MPPQNSLNNSVRAPHVRTRVRGGFSPSRNRSDLSHPAPLVIPTGAKRSGGICSAPCGSLKSFLGNLVVEIWWIVAIEGLIPDRRAGSSEKKSAPPPTGQIYEAAWLGEQRGETTGPQHSPDLVRDADGRRVPDPPPGAAADAPWNRGLAPDLTLDSSEPIFVRPFSPTEMTETTPSSPHARVPASAPDKRVPSPMEKNPSTWRLRL